MLAGSLPVLVVHNSSLDLGHKARYNKTQTGIKKKPKTSAKNLYVYSNPKKPSTENNLFQCYFFKA
jgi:hypothetical protein